MGTALTSTTAERQIAIQELEAAYAQPDGTLLFTYNGVVYQTVGMNADSTLTVRNLATGQTTTLDPVNVYSAARDASGDPLPPPPTPNYSSQQSSIMQQLTGQAGLVVGIANLLVQSLGTWARSVVTSAANMSNVMNNLSALDPGTTFVAGAPTTASSFHIWANTILNNPIFKEVLGVIGVVLGTYSTFQGARAFYQKPSLSGIFGLGTGAMGVAAGVNTLLGTVGLATFTNPAGWFAAGAVVAASFTYAGINDWITNGFSWGAFGTTLLSTAGLAIAAEGAIAFAAPALVAAVPFIGPFIALGMVLFSVLWSLFHQPPDEEIAAKNLTKALSPVIWSTAPLILVGAGTVAALMGWGHTPPASGMTTLTVPANYAMQTLSQSPIYAVQGQPFNGQTPTVIVESATVNNLGQVVEPGKVVIITPDGTDGHGDPVVTMQSYLLTKNLNFVYSDQPPAFGTYIPFFRYVNGKLDKNPNPALTQALTTQDKMLQSVLSGYLSTSDAMSAIRIASAVNKYGVNVAN